MTSIRDGYDPEFFSEYGYLHFRPREPQFLEDVAEARQVFQELVRESSGNGLRTAFKNKDGKVRHLLFVHKHHDIFRRLMLSAEVKALAQGVFQSRRLYVTHSKISYKEAGQDLPWYPHQDNGYRLVNRAPLRNGMTVAIFLEDADDLNGTLQIFPRSHKLRTLPHIFEKENNDDWSGQIVIEHLPKGLEPRSIIARQGDVVIFTFDTVHQSKPNFSHGHRPLLLFEIEPYAGFPSDDEGNSPFLISGNLSTAERLLCRLHGIPKRLKLAIGSIPIFKTWYRKLKFG